MPGRRRRCIVAATVAGALIGALALAGSASAQTADPSATTTTTATPTPDTTAGTTATAAPPRETTPGTQHPRIVNGPSVSATAYPWMAALLDSSEPDPDVAQFCGGALIDPQWIVTAAHCTYEDFGPDSFGSANPLLPSDIDVAVGHTLLSSIGAGDRVAVSEIDRHPGYNPSNTSLLNDIALLKLTSPVLGVPTLAYATDQSGEQLGQSGGVLGWGATARDLSSYPDDLHGAVQEVTRAPGDTNCSSTGLGFDTASEICAEGPTTLPHGDRPQPCDLDDGGPFVIGTPGGFRLIGVLSYYDFSSCGFGENQYARVSHYATFIDGFLSAPTGAGTYHPVPPVRVLDTRTGTGGLASGALGPSGVINAQITGMEAGGVPFGQKADAVVVNLFSVGSTSAGWLTAYPTGGATPLAANLNFNPGDNVANLVTVQLGQGGKISIANSTGSASAGYVNVIVDVVGWYSADATGDLFQAASAPARMLDTRTGSGFAQAPAVPSLGLLAGGQLSVQFCPPDHTGPIPSGVSALVINATVVPSTRTNNLAMTPLPGFGGWLTMWPSGSPPLAANVTHDGIHTTGSLSIVKTAGCSFMLANTPGGSQQDHNPFHVILDIIGWYGAGGAQFHPMPPNRILDTRTGTADNPSAGALASGSTMNVVARGGLTGVPNTAAAFIVNTTAVGPATAGWLNVYPQEPVPDTSSLNFGAGQTVANLVASGFVADTIRLGNTTFPTPVNGAHGPVNVVMDVSGWFE